MIKKLTKPTLRIKDIIIRFDFIRVLPQVLTILSQLPESIWSIRSFISISNFFSAISKCLFARPLPALHTGEKLHVFVLHWAPNKFVKRFITHTTTDITIWIFYDLLLHRFVWRNRGVKVASWHHIYPLPQKKNEQFN